jgi:hypothetical protein
LNLRPSGYEPQPDNSIESFPFNDLGSKHLKWRSLSATLAGFRRSSTARNASKTTVAG